MDTVQLSGIYYNVEKGGMKGGKFNSILNSVTTAQKKGGVSYLILREIEFRLRQKALD